jgi:hypothetical protein
LRDEGAYAVAELIGDLPGADELEGHDVEQVPVDTCELDGGVGDLPAEARADGCDGVAKEGVEAGADVGDALHPTFRLRRQMSESCLHTADAVINAVIAQYTDPNDHGRDVLLMITTDPALRATYVDTATAIEAPLAEAIAQRCHGMDRLTTRVLSASVGAAVKVALRTWLGSPTASAAASGLVVPSGSLPDLLRTALGPLAPALDAAATHADC